MDYTSELLILEWGAEQDTQFRFQKVGNQVYFTPIVSGDWVCEWGEGKVDVPWDISLNTIFFADNVTLTCAVHLTHLPFHSQHTVFFIYMQCDIVNGSRSKGLVFQSPCFNHIITTESLHDDPMCHFNGPQSKGSVFTRPSPTQRARYLIGDSVENLRLCLYRMFLHLLVEVYRRKSFEGAYIRCTR